MSDRSFCSSLQKSEWAIALFCSFQKSDEKSDRSFALSKRATKRVIKERMSENEHKMSGFPNRSFFAQKRAIAHVQNKQLANPGCRVGQLLICSFAHFRSFQKSDWAIPCSFALLKRAIERSLLSLFSLLFAKERMSDRSFSLFSKERRKERSLFRSFKKSKRAKMSKKWEILQIAHFSLKKMSECPTLVINA